MAELEKLDDKSSHGGRRPGSGRKPGIPNKISGDLKRDIIEAAEKAGGEGGIVEYLTMQANKNPGPFLSLLGKVLPMQVVGDPDNPIRTVTRIELVALQPKNDSRSD